MTPPARLLCSLGVALLLIGADAAPETYWFEPQRSGGMTATLGVRCAESTTAATPVTLLVVIEGPPTLEAEPARLSDSVDAWEAKRVASSAWTGDGQAYREEIRLTPKQSGVQPLPSVSVRFRAAPDAEWQRAEWTAPLKELRSGPSPDIPPRPTPALRQWWLVIVLAAGGSLLVAVLLEWLLHWRRRPQPTLAERALADLGRLDLASDGLHAELARVLRRFVGESEGLPAHERTTAELLDALAARPGWDAERLGKLGEVLRRCDLALYAAASPREEERRVDLERAREVVADADVSAGAGGAG